MKNINDIYKKSFFGRRNKLNWRAPHFCGALKSTLDFDSVIDCGAAIGDIVAEFIRIGCDAYGIEGSENAREFLVCPQERMFFYDLSKVLPEMKYYDLCTCLEVLEHIEERYAYILTSNLCRLAPKILVSAAPPGQEGHHHVNCQPAEYWKRLFSLFGFTRIPHIEEQIKNKLEPWKKKPGIKAYYQNLLYFEAGSNNV